jgi:hypothetical protein
MDVSKLESLIKRMEPTEDCLVEGLISWVTEDDTYWKASLGGSSILHNCERALREFLGFKSEFEYAYTVLKPGDFTSIPETLFASDIPNDTQKDWIVFSTPILKTLGCFWKQDKSSRLIIEEDEQSFSKEIARHGDLEEYLRSFYGSLSRKGEGQTITCLSCKKQFKKSETRPVWLNLRMCQECRESRKDWRRRGGS